MKKKYENVVRLLVIWRGLTNEEQLNEYEQFIKNCNLYEYQITKWEDNENGGQHDWFIFHNGELTNNPKDIIDELVEIDDIRLSL